MREDNGFLAIEAATTHTARLRARLDRIEGEALDYQRSPHGSLTDVLGEDLFRLDQDIVIAMANNSARTCVPAALAVIGAEIGQQRDAGRRARWSSDTDKNGAIQPGAIGSYRLTDGTKVEWRIVEVIRGGSSLDLQDTIETEDTDLIIVEALLPGSFEILPIRFPGGAIVRAAVVIYRGIDPESYGSFRARLLAITTSPSSAIAGLRSALQRQAAVVAASVRQIGPGQVEVTVATVDDPGAGDAVDIGQTIYQWIGAATSYVDPAAAPGTVIRVDVDGAGTEPQQVGYRLAARQDVIATIAITTDGTITDSDAMVAGVAALQAHAATLGPGATLHHALAFAAVAQVSGIVGVVLTLDGGTVDIAPSTGVTIFDLDITAEVT